MENKLVHSITAYSCKICQKYKSEDLLSTDNEHKIELENLLAEYFEYINNCKIDQNTNRAIKLSNSILKKQINDNTTRIIFKPDAGKALENFSVINISTNKIQKFNGDENSAIYPHYVFCYTNNNKNIFVFHHYGQSGCKTVFSNTFNRFLGEKHLIAHFDVLMSDEMLDESNSYSPQKLKLITTYNEKSSDKADNVSEESKKTEQEIIISLEAPRAKNIKEWIKKLSQTRKQPDIDELKEILIEDNYSTDFEEAKLSVKFGKVTRLISLSEFSGLIAEYDITDKIRILADRTIEEESFFSVVDTYALSFLEQE